MKCEITKMTRRNFRIRKLDHKVEGGGTWLLIDIPEEIYEEIRNKLHDKPYTGIHSEIINLKRGQITSSEVVLDYLYNNGFDYLFEKENEEQENQK